MLPFHWGTRKNEKAGHKPAYLYNIRKCLSIFVAGDRMFPEETMNDLLGAGRSQCASGQAGVKTIFNSPTLYPEMAVQVNREKK
jgi:hypothetical protein